MVVGNCTSGFGWYSELKMVVAEKEVCRTYLKVCIVLYMLCYISLNTNMCLYLLCVTVFGIVNYSYFECELPFLMSHF